jgi:hypothetical protein
MRNTDFHPLTNSLGGVESDSVFQSNAIKLMLGNKKSLLFQRLLVGARIWTS